MLDDSYQGPRGATEPRIHTPIWEGESKMQEVADLADMIGQPLLPWQRYVLHDFMSINSKGEFRKKLGVLCISRQNGKTHLARMLILWYLLQGKKVLAMSSNRNMALDTFNKVAGLFEEHDFLKAQVKAIRYANGTEKIHLLNGGLYEVAAASRDGSRGKTVDLLFVDELREISQDAWTAARPTTRATGGQTFSASNAGDHFSVVLNTQREAALSYPPETFAWYEYSAPNFCKLDDREAWRIANPAMGYLFGEDAIEEAIATNTVEASRTETLCQWIDSLASPWPQGAWEELGNKDLVITTGGKIVFGFDISPDRRNAALVAGKVSEDGLIGVGLLQTWESQVAVDEQQVAVGIKGWFDKLRPQLVCYDKYATQSVADKLFHAGVKVQDVSGQHFYQACGDLYDAIVNKKLIHQGQPVLDQQMLNVAAKVNDSAWRIVKRKSAGTVAGPISLAMVVHELVKPAATAQIFI